MASIFSRIVQGELPCYKVAESDEFLAFLDINPLKRGHTLVVPKQEIDYFFDLPDDMLSGLTVFSKKVSGAIQDATGCTRVGVAVIGFDVPHAHLHLIPIETVADMNFANPKLEFTTEEFEGTAEAIRGSF